MRLWSWNMSPLHSHSRLFFPFNFRIYALRNAVLCQLNISIHRGDSAGKKKNQGIHHWHLEWVPGELASLQSYWSSVEAVGLKSCQEGFKQIYVLFFKKQMKQQELAADGMGCTWDWTNVAKLVEFSRDCIIGVEINLQQDAGLLLRTATLRIVCSQSRREQNQKNLMPNSGEKKKRQTFSGCLCYLRDQPGMSYLSLSYTAVKVPRNEVMAFNRPQLYHVFLFELRRWPWLSEMHGSLKSHHLLAYKIKRDENNTSAYLILNTIL